MKQILLLLSIFISMGLSAQHPHNTASLPRNPNEMDTVTGLWAWGSILQPNDDTMVEYFGYPKEAYIRIKQKDTLIQNLEYVTVRYATGDRKLYHIMFLIKRGKEYFYPNMYPVLVKNYKQKDSAEVIVKK